MDKPEALRLANELDAYHTAPHHKHAAAELRRLHELLEAEQTLHQRVIYPELQRLRAQRDALLEALRQIVEQHGQWNNGIWAANIARAAIALVEGRVKAVEETK